MGALLAIDRLRQVQGNLPSDQSSKTINIAATIAKVTATAKAIWVPRGGGMRRRARGKDWVLVPQHFDDRRAISNFFVSCRMALPDIASRVQWMMRRPANTGGLCYVAHETTLEAKAPEDGRPDVGSRRAVIVTGERRIRCSCGEYSGAACRREPRIYSGRRGTL
jgi:hypothetical protein